MDAWGPDSWPHTCTAGTLPTESSSLSCILFLKASLVLGRWFSGQSVCDASLMTSVQTPRTHEEAGHSSGSVSLWAETRVTRSVGTWAHSIFVRWMLEWQPWGEYFINTNHLSFSGLFYFLPLHEVSGSPVGSGIAILIWQR